MQEETAPALQESPKLIQSGTTLIKLYKLMTGNTTNQALVEWWTSGGQVVDSLIPDTI
jgi:hypothetical protein